MTTAKHPSMRGSDDIERALKLLVRAQERMAPYGVLRFTLEWLPVNRKKANAAQRVRK